MARKYKKKGRVLGYVKGKSLTLMSRQRGLGKKKRQLRNKTSVSMGLGFPKRVVVTHKYNEIIPLTSTAGVINKYLYSCNGMFDPNITGTGHQPMYFDAYSGIYDHYTVIGSKIVIRATISSTTNTASGITGLYIDDDTTTTNVSDLSVVAEQSSGKVKVITPTMSRQIVFSKSWSAKKTFGGSILGNDNLQGTAAANPTEQSYYVFALQAMNNANITVNYDVSLTYIAVWDELRDQATN